MRSAFISGNLGADPELYSSKGSEYACLKFNIANSDKVKKNEQGGYDNIPQWFTVKFWTKKPQDWLQKLMKGTSIVVDTDIEVESWEKDGQNFHKMVFIVKRGSYPFVQNKSNHGPVPSCYSTPEPQQVPEEVPTFTDEIPF